MPNTLPVSLHAFFHAMIILSAPLLSQPFRLSVSSGWKNYYSFQRVLRSNTVRKREANVLRYLSSSPNLTLDDFDSMKMRRQIQLERGRIGWTTDQHPVLQWEKVEGGNDDADNNTHWNQFSLQRQRSNTRQKDGRKIQELPPNLRFHKKENDDANDWYDADTDTFDPTITNVQKRRNKGNGAKTFDDHATGDRVFVQGLPLTATWEDVKQHFSIAGEVVYASISKDLKSGASKQCGIVQYKTPDMAAKAIRDMRNHPMNGATLYVRKDVQERRCTFENGRQQQREVPKGRRGYAESDYGGSFNNGDGKVDGVSNIWRRANDEGDGKGIQYDLDEDELNEIEQLLNTRELVRRKKNYQRSDALRDELEEKYGVYVDDDMKLWWTSSNNGGVPELISKIKGEGRWGKLKSWRQIPTTPENDALVDSNLVTRLLSLRDKARKRKDFDTADDFLERAKKLPHGSAELLIHDESRTWRIWTEKPPPKQLSTPKGTITELTPAEMCVELVQKNDQEKVDEIKVLLKKFPGREWLIYRRLTERYN